MDKQNERMDAWNVEKEKNKLKSLFYAFFKWRKQ